MAPVKSREPRFQLSNILFREESSKCPSGFDLYYKGKNFRSAPSLQIRALKE